MPASFEHIVVTVAKIERGGKREELAPRVRVEKTLGLGVVGNGLAEIKPGGSTGHGRVLRERARGEPGKRSLFRPGSPASGRPLTPVSAIWMIVQRLQALRPAVDSAPQRRPRFARHGLP